MSHFQRRALVIVYAMFVFGAVGRFACADWTLDYPFEGAVLQKGREIVCNGRGAYNGGQFTVALLDPSGVIVDSKRGVCMIHEPGSMYYWAEEFIAPINGWTPTGTGWKIQLYVKGVLKDSATFELR